MLFQINPIGQAVKYIGSDFVLADVRDAYPLLVAFEWDGIYLALIGPTFGGIMMYRAHHRQNVNVYYTLVCPD